MANANYPCMTDTEWFLIQEIHEAPDGKQLVRFSFVSEDEHLQQRCFLGKDDTENIGFEVQTCVRLSAEVLPLYKGFPACSTVSNRYRTDQSSSFDEKFNLKPRPSMAEIIAGRNQFQSSIN